MTQFAGSTTGELAPVVDAIRAAQRIVVLSHVNPDSDAIGTALGLALGLRAMGKNATPVLSDPVPEYAMFLAGAADIVNALPEDGDPIDLLICGDAAGIDRIGRLYETHTDVFGSIPIVNIDHHRTNPLYGTVNYVDPAASSTSEMVFRLLGALNVPIDQATANALLFGITGDTGSFRNGATTPGALQTAARLVELGADTQAISYHLFESLTFAAARIWGRIVGSIDLDRERGIVFGLLTQQMLREEGATMDETEGVAEYLRGVDEAEVVMLLKETPEGEMRISMRSRPAVDVAAIASAFAGGGHRQAAGCTLPGPAESARAALVAAYDTLYRS